MIVRLKHPEIRNLASMCLCGIRDPVVDVEAQVRRGVGNQRSSARIDVCHSDTGIVEQIQS